MTFRFLHTADWQLGKSFANVPGDAGALLRQARFDAVRRLASLAHERGCHAVLVAGDAFDSAWPDARTLHGAIGAMRGFTGPWIILPGNHDPGGASDLWERVATLAGDLDLRLALKPAPMVLVDGRATVLPAPLSNRHAFEDPTAWMDSAETPAGSLRIGLAHGSVRDFGASEASPNLIDPARADKARLNYLALGDWHGLIEINPRTYYSGTPEPDRFSENDPGNALIVELANDTPPNIEPVPTAAFGWQKLNLSLADGAAAAVDRAERLVKSSPTPDKMLLALTLEGSIDLAGRAELQAAIDDWSARIAYLQVDDRGLRDAPSEADLAMLAQGSGVVAATASRLAGDETEQAALALRYLYDLAQDQCA